MSIEYAILGLLSWQPMTGYDLKKIIAESDLYYWSGNNNQIYNSLVHLHKEELVTQQVQAQESLPSKKVYSITEKGRAALLKWISAPPDLPELRSTFLIQLAWADALPPAELDALLARYEEELDVQMQMRRQIAEQTRQGKRAGATPQRSEREAYLWQKIEERMTAIYQTELDWARALRKDLSARWGDV